MPTTIFGFFTRTEGETFVISISDLEKWKDTLRTRHGLPEADVILFEEKDWLIPEIKSKTIDELKQKYTLIISTIKQVLLGRGVPDLAIDDVMKKAEVIPNPISGLVVFTVAYLGDLGKKIQIQEKRSLISRLFRPSDPEIEKMIQNGNFNGLFKAISHHNISIQSAAISGLGRLGDTRAVDILVKLLKKNELNPEVQRAVEKGLYELFQIAPERLVSELDCDDSKFRRTLCNIILSVENIPKKLKLLVSSINALDTDQNEKCFEALKTLGELRDRRAVPAIGELLSRESISILRVTALQTLGIIGDERAYKYAGLIKKIPDMKVFIALFEMINELPGEKSIFAGIQLFQIYAKQCVMDESLFLALEKWLNRFESYCKGLSSLGGSLLSEIEFARKAFNASRAILRDESIGNENFLDVIQLFLGPECDRNLQDVLDSTDPLHPVLRQLNKIGALFVLGLQLEKDPTDIVYLKYIRQMTWDLLTEAMVICPEDYALKKLHDTVIRIV